MDIVLENSYAKEFIKNNLNIQHEYPQNILITTLIHLLPYFHEQMVHKQQDETKMDSLEVLMSETKKKMKVKS